ncbi:MAG: GTP cyclohydrolase I FolE [Phycisphaerales bacterium]|nr:GTP cyclohydrolase I FolE [Phycisphaerales bacterium]
MIASLHSIATARAGRTQARTFDQPRAEAAIRELLLALGEDPDRDGLADTPKRVARMYQEVFSGLHADASDHLARVFDESSDGVILLRDIPFTSMCEHHLLPFVGRADVAYLPKGRVVGLSKLARVVDVFARRPQVQERLTRQIADAIMHHTDAAGAFVRIESEHFCMKVRGVRKSGSRMVTSARRGVFKTDPAAREELRELLRGGGDR